MSERLHIDARDFASVDAFRGVSEHGLQRIADLARIRRLPRRTRVFSQGDADVRAHAALEGAVQIVQAGSDGAQSVMQIASSGQTFGTIALFTDRRYSADAITMSETVEASWSEVDFLDLLGAHARIAVNLLCVVARCLQEMQNRVRELATRSAEQRIAAAILRLAEQTGRTTFEGIAIGVPLRRKDVADIAGTTLYTASRLLAAWEKAGIIANGKRMLTVVRVPELRAIRGD